MALEFQIDHSCLSHHSIAKYLRSLSINSMFRPTPRGVFNVHTLYKISVACDSLSDPPLYRAIFLVAFYGFLRMSNIAPHSAKLFSQDRHFLRQDVILVLLAFTWSSSGLKHSRTIKTIILSNSQPFPTHICAQLGPSGLCFLLDPFQLLHHFLQIFFHLSIK